MPVEMFTTVSELEKKLLEYFKRDGSRTVTGDCNWTGHAINNMGHIIMKLGKTLNAISGNILLPLYVTANPVAYNMRYNHATDVFEIYDGTTWRPH